MDATAASMDGSKKLATSALDVCVSNSLGLSRWSYPVSFNWPPLIPTVLSLSRGEPNGTYWGSCESRKRRFVVSSNRLVMWSKESGVPYLESFNLTDRLSEGRIERNLFFSYLRGIPEPDGLQTQTQQTRLWDKIRQWPERLTWLTVWWCNFINH